MTCFDQRYIVLHLLVYCLDGKYALVKRSPHANPHRHLMSTIFSNLLSFVQKTGFPSSTR